MSNTNRTYRRRSERAEQLYNARMLPDADETAAYSAAPVNERAAARHAAYEQAHSDAPVQPYAQSTVPAEQSGYDPSLYTSNEPTGQSLPVQPYAQSAVPAEQPGYDPSLYTSNEPTGQSLPVQPYAQSEMPAEQSGYDPSLYTSNEPTGESLLPNYAAFMPPADPDAASAAETYAFPPIPASQSEQTEPDPDTERSVLAANLSAYYRRAANVAPQEETAPFDLLDWSEGYEEDSWQEGGEDPAVNVYRVQEANWAQEERQTMLADADAEGYQVTAEERLKPVKRRRKKRKMRRTVMALAIAGVLAGGLLWLAGQEKPQSATTASSSAIPAPTATPQPIRGYDAAPAMAVSDKTSQAIEQISGPVQMATYAVTDSNVLTRSMRADGLYDYYLFASDGRLLAYFDQLPADGMFPVDGGGFYAAMEPWLIDEEGRAMIDLTQLENTLGEEMTLHPMMNGWAKITDASGSHNLIDREGQLISRLWFCRSFPMTGSETVAYVDTGVEGSATRYTLYAVSGKDAGTIVKWRDAADNSDVVASALGMVYLQNGQLYRIADLIDDPAAPPLLETANVRFYTDCAAMVVQDAASGKYALYVNGQQHYDFVYDSILPVESDVRWQGDILPAQAGQAMVLAIGSASYPQPLSHYFVLSRDGAEEYVALSAVTNCPIILE